MTCWLSFQSKDNTLDHNCVSNLVTRQYPSPLRHRVCNVETVPSFAAGTLQFREREEQQCIHSGSMWSLAAEARRHRTPHSHLDVQ